MELEKKGKGKILTLLLLRLGPPKLLLLLGPAAAKSSAVGGSFSRFRRLERYACDPSVPGKLMGVVVELSLWLAPDPDDSLFEFKAIFSPGLVDTL